MTVIHKVKEALRLVREDGWVYDGMVGSHRQFSHPMKPGRVTIPGKESEDLAPKTWMSILRQAGLR